MMKDDVIFMMMMMMLMMMMMMKDDVVLHMDLFQAYSSRSFVELSDSEDDDNDSLLSLQELR